ncbi:MAG: hypothetical protein FWF79_09090 [Defluviitaleaceae bacterium]|nr:hypothetical protein [Defluviitaleaceae bacterium]
MNEKTERSGSFHERRRQADWVVNGAAILSVLSWIVAFTVLLVLEMASPDGMEGFTRTFGGIPETTWNYTLLPAAFILLIFALISCIAAFIFNAMRMRRKTDKYRKSILIIGAFTFVGLIAFTVRFGSQLF